MHRIVVLTSTLLLLLGLLVPTIHAQTSDEHQLRFRAETVGGNNKIDDKFNELAPEGWIPQFVLTDEFRARLIFSKPRNKEIVNTTMTYHAETVGQLREIDDKINQQASEGWIPAFVLEDGFRYRILFKRDKETEIQLNHEYKAELISESNQIDDKFNQYGVDGWKPLFVLPDSDRFRVIFGREKIEEQPRWRYRAVKTLYTKDIDDTFNDIGSEGWVPILTFQDGVEYRTIFQEGEKLEYKAELTKNARDIEDKFNQFNADGWLPHFVFKFAEDTTLLEEGERYRIIFSM